MNFDITFGIVVYLIAIIIPLIHNNGFKAKYIALFLSLTVYDAFINIGYIVKIGSFALEYNMMSSIILFIPSIYILITNDVNKKVKNWFIIFLVCILLGALKSIISRQEIMGITHLENWDTYFAEHKPIHLISFNMPQFLIMLLRFTITFINMSAFGLLFNQHYLKILTKIIRTYMTISLIIYVIEMILYNFTGSISFRETLVNLLGPNGFVYVYPRVFLNKIYTPLLLLSEPAAVAFAFFISGCNEIFLFNYKKEKSSILLLFILMIFLLMTSAMTSILYLIVLAISFLSTLFKNKSHLILSLIFIFLVMIGPIIAMYNEELTIFLDNVKLYKYGIPYLSTNSKVVRTYSIYIEIIHFIKNPVLGIGLGTSFSHSGFFTMLSNIGIFGTIASFKLISNYYSNFNFKKSSYLLAIFSIIIVYSISGNFSMYLYIQYTQILFFLLIASNKSERSNLHLTNKEKSMLVYLLQNNQILI